MNRKQLLSALAVISFAGINTGISAEQTSLEKPEPGARQFLDWMGNWPKLYAADKKENPYIQEFNLSLRMQYQAGWTKPNGEHSQGGGHDDGFRRFRMGANAKMLNGKLKLVNVWDIGGVVSGRAKSSDGTWHHVDTKAHLYELNGTYTAKPVDISVGKMKPAITSEYKTSSSAIITVERSVLVNQLRPETNWGIQFKNSDKKDKIGWLFGTYLNAEGGGKRGDELEFNSEDNAFVMGSLSYDTSGVITKKGRVWLDYIHNFTDYIGDEKYPAYGNERAYKGPGARDIAALSWDMEQNRFSMVTELMAGFSIANAPTSEAKNLYGLVLMPSYKFSPNWEGVFRYQYATGKDAIKVEKRYATTTTTSTKYADSLHAFYLGLNYYIDSKNPNMAKIMAGIEYSNYKNDKGHDQKYAFTGLTYYLSFRTNF